MTVSLTFCILAVIGFCAITCAVTIDVAYHKGCAKSGYSASAKEPAPESVDLHVAQ